MDQQNFGDYTAEQIAAMPTGKICRDPLRRIEASLREAMSEFEDFSRPTKAEPAPGSDAEHPPVGYVLVPSASADKIKSDWLVWAWDQGPWQAFKPGSIGLPRNQSDYAVSRPIPANEGDSRLAESVAIPVGWVAVGTHAKGPGTYREHGGQWIKPDPSIPWGEGYEAILPSEATKDDWRLCDGDWLQHSICMDGPKKIGWWGDAFPWRRRIPATTPTECDHDWRYASRWTKPGFESRARCQKCDARKWDPTTPTEPARDLSAEVERLEAELETTKRLLAESLVERDRLKNLHDARKVRIEGFRDILREQLGDLV